MLLWHGPAVSTVSLTFSKLGKGGTRVPRLSLRNAHAFFGAFGGFDRDGSPPFFGVDVANGVKGITSGLEKVPFINEG